MISSLPMYDWPEVVTSTDEIWAGLREELREQGIDAPQNLTRDLDDNSLWLSPDLLLSQTCGCPFATRLKGKVQYVATPLYDVEGCEHATYSSAIVVHKSSGLRLETIKGQSFAYNAPDSWSGNKSLVEKFGELSGFFGVLDQSGSHRQSARRVAHGTAAVAAIDAVCWNLLQQFEPATSLELKVIGRTAPRPALPFITSIELSANRLKILRNCLRKVLSANSKSHKTLGIAGCAVINEQDYWPMGLV